MANQYVATSDGKIGFARSEYYMHTCDLNVDSKKWEIWLWTRNYPTGRVIRFSSEQLAKRCAMDISKQLTEE